MNRNTITKKICENCGKEYTAKSNNSKYCSEQCKRIVMRKQRTDRRNSNPIKKGFAEDIRMSYAFRCALCFWKSGSMENDGCELHHIKPVCEGGEHTQDNLILLCPNCHKLVHLGIIPNEILEAGNRRARDPKTSVPLAIIGAL